MASLMALFVGAFTQYLVQPIFNPNLPLKIQRKRLDFIQRFAPMPWGVNKSVIHIADVPVWQFHPKNPRSGHLLYLHGGGYVLGSPQSHADLVARIAKRTGITATLIDYRLAPEHPFPAALDDAFAVYKTLMNEGPVVVAGDSAGGGMTLALMQRIRDKGLPTPKALVVFSPFTDLSLSGESIKDRSHRERILNTAWLRKVAPLYSVVADPLDPLISPLYADFTGFPATLIQVGSEEILYSDSTRLYKKMKAAGVDVSFTEFAGMWHVFQIHAGYMSEAACALEEAAEFFNRNL